MIRRIITATVLAAALATALPGPAQAYINAPGTPIRTGVTYNALPVTGTCTIGGTTTPVTEFRLSLVSAVNWVDVSGTTLMFHYSLTAVCGSDWVLSSFAVPLAYTISDPAGTLTITGTSVPASFTGDTVNGVPGTATVTAGSGPLGPIVYGADNPTETSGVVSRHRSIDRAKTLGDKASQLSQLITYLQ